MAADTKIEWARHTFNAWIGCTPLSKACDNCYAETWAKRTGNAHLWNGERRRTTDAYWRQPLKWNAAAAEAGQRHRVFCASLADVFDNQADAAWRADLWKLIAATPNLDWLLLTKRPQNIAKMLPGDWGGGYANVWLGTTVEDQTEADRRIPHLLDAPAKVHFLSCEPLLGTVDLSSHLWGPSKTCLDCPKDADCSCEYETRASLGEASIGWVICGGESGPGARPMHPDWARSLRDQCADAGVAFHFKQWGEWAPTGDWYASHPRSLPLRVLGPNGWTNEGGTEGEWLARIGKKASGRLLDGVQHDGEPA